LNTNNYIIALFPNKLIIISEKCIYTQVTSSLPIKCKFFYRHNQSFIKLQRHSVIGELEAMSNQRM